MPRQLLARGPRGCTSTLRCGSDAFRIHWAPEETEVEPSLFCSLWCLGHTFPIHPCSEPTPSFCPTCHRSLPHLALTYPGESPSQEVPLEGGSEGRFPLCRLRLQVLITGLALPLQLGNKLSDASSPLLCLELGMHTTWQTWTYKQMPYCSWLRLNPILELHPALCDASKGGIQV